MHSRLFLLTWQRKNQGVEVIRGRLYGSFPKTKEQVNSEKKFSIKSVVSVFTKILCLVLAIAVPVLWGAVIVSSYQDAENVLKSGEYETVKGPVENFHPKSKEEAESFVIDGVFFEYSDNDTAPGYHSTSRNGGVVTSNGQELQIDYYFDEYGDVTILRIIDIAGNTGTNALPSNETYE